LFLPTSSFLSLFKALKKIKEIFVNLKLAKLALIVSSLSVEIIFSFLKKKLTPTSVCDFICTSVMKIRRKKLQLHGIISGLEITILQNMLSMVLVQTRCKKIINFNSGFRFNKRVVLGIV